MSLFVMFLLSILLFYCFACSDRFSLKPTKAKIIATIIITILLALIILLALRII